MLTLHTLRQARSIACWVLAWFVMSVGVAVAAPIFQPQSMALVCSTAGEVKFVSGTDDGSTAGTGHLLDCVLCLVLDAPPAVTVQVAAPVSPLAYALMPIPAAHIAWRTASPLPARGPPTLL